MGRLAKICAGLGMAALVAGTMPAFAGIQHDRVVSTNPVDWTPIVEDGGGVWGSATVGDITVIGGSFTSVLQRNGTRVARDNIFAFNANGTVSNTFVPNISLRVWDVIPAGDGVSVYVGGQFNNVDGRGGTSRVARINVNTGQVMTTFRSPGFDNIVTDLHLANGRLYVGGYFKNAGGQPRVGLVALNPTTGALTDHLDQVTFAGIFRDSARTSVPSGLRGTGVERFAMTPDGSRLVAIGNFRTVGGLSRVQVAMIDTSGTQATVTDWSTTRYSPACSQNFPTYTLGLDISPDGEYFVIATGGAFNGGVNSGTLCDTAARWEIDASGPNQQPTWVDYMGGDTSTAVGITGSAVYIGGHFRWANNPYAGDRVGPGAVGRKGMAALDPRNGLPFMFNAAKLPLRWGVTRFNSDDQGLWVNHDGDRLGNETTGRMGLMPLTGGKVLPADDTGSLPGDAYRAGSRPEPTGPNPVLYRVNAGGPEIGSLDGLGDWSADAASTSPYRNSGSNAAPWSQTFSRTSAVPPSTPTEVFNAERWDPGSLPPMQWDFPVASGLPIQVRLYFGNGCSCTSLPLLRMFDVSLEGQVVLDNYDIVADTGAHSRGTMKAFDIVSDGNVDIDFSHVVENPLVNAIEIVRTDIPTPPLSDDDGLVRTSLTETAATDRTEVDNGGIDWSSARGAFMADNRLYTGWADGTFTWRPMFGNGSFGSARNINLHDLTAFSSELPNIRGMWFDRTTGRMYFTLRNQSALYYRYFTPESTTVGAVRFTAPNPAGLNWGNVTGGFLANGKLYYGSTDGDLRSIQWQDGPVAGTTATVSGPAVDGHEWGSGSLFLHVR